MHTYTAALKTKELTCRPIPLRLALKKQTPQSHTFKGIKKSRKWNLWSWRLSSLWAFSGFFQHQQLKPSHKEQRESIWVVSEQPAFSCRAQTTCSAPWTTHFQRLWTQIHTRLCVGARMAVVSLFRPTTSLAYMFIRSCFSFLSCAECVVWAWL